MPPGSAASKGLLAATSKKKKGKTKPHTECGRRYVTRRRPPLQGWPVFFRARGRGSIARGKRKAGWARKEGRRIGAGGLGLFGVVYFRTWSTEGSRTRRARSPEISGATTARGVGPARRTISGLLARSAGLKQPSL